MQKLMIILASLLPSATLADAFDRPIPQPQSATAELLFLVASLALIAALVAVHLLVRRR